MQLGTAWKSPWDHLLINYSIFPVSSSIGVPWLSTHNHQFDWAWGNILAWGTQNHSQSLCSALFLRAPAIKHAQPLNMLKLSSIPPAYHELWEVFSKDLALSLPSHQPYRELSTCFAVPRPLLWIFWIPDVPHLSCGEKYPKGTGAGLGPRRGFSRTKICALDIITGLPESYEALILTVMDRFSTALHLVALPKLPSALDTSRNLYDQVFWLHGLLSEMVSDRGPSCNSFSIRASASLSSGFHPQTKGQAERANQEVKVAFHWVTSQNPSHGLVTWPGCNTLSTLFLFANMDRLPLKPCWDTYHPCSQIRNLCLQYPPYSITFLIAREHWWLWGPLCLRQTNVWNRPAAVIADPVLATTPAKQSGFPHVTSLCAPSPANWPPHFIWPYIITKVINPLAVCLCLPSHISIHRPSMCIRSNSSKLLFFVVRPNPHLPLLVDSLQAYTVRRLLDSRHLGRRMQYLVIPRSSVFLLQHAKAIAIGLLCLSHPYLSTKHGPTTLH